MLPVITDLHIETLPDQLQRLTDDELINGLQLAMRGEQRMTLRVLHHLNEVERRRLHLDRGYGSLFDYCIRKLKYSPSAAGRRIQATRCVRRHPRVLGMLQNHELSLSVVALIEPILTDENSEWILERVRGCSHREVHRVVAEFRPPVAFRDRIVPVRVAVPVADADKILFEREISRRSPYAQQVTIQDQMIVQFLADEELVQQFEEAKALLSQRGNDPSFAAVMKALLAEFLERHSPMARHARREARKRAAGPDSRHRECETKNESVAAEIGATTPDSRHRECGTTGERTRYIPPEIRDAVYASDGGRCTFEAPDGTRCGSRHGLQVDHKVPYAAGGTNDISNLRLLCAAHNRRAAEKLLGAEVMRPFYPRE